MASDISGSRFYRRQPLGRSAGASVWIVIAALMVSGCLAAPQTASPTATPVAAPTPDPLTSLESAVRLEVVSKLAHSVGGGVAYYEVLSSSLVSEGTFGKVSAQLIPAGCPLFTYELTYNAELADGEWVLYDDGDGMGSLLKLWATARSAALGGERVPVPGAAIDRQVMLIPDGMPELLTSRLDGLSNSTVDPMAGFFVCQSDRIRWDQLDKGLAGELESLIPQLRETMEAEVASLLDS